MLLNILAFVFVILILVALRSLIIGSFNKSGSPGYSKAMIGDYKGVIEDCDNVIKSNQKNATTARAYCNRGLAKSILTDNNGAVEDFSKVLDLLTKGSILRIFRYDPIVVFLAYHNRGLAKSALGDKKDAIADFDNAIAQATKIMLEKRDVDCYSALAYCNRGSAKYNIGDYKGAMFDYDMAVKLNPNHTEAYYNRGTAKYISGDYNGALEDFHKAIDLSPEYPQSAVKSEKAIHTIPMLWSRLMLSGTNRPMTIEGWEKAIPLNPSDKDKLKSLIDKARALGIYK